MKFQLVSVTTALVAVSADQMKNPFHRLLNSNTTILQDLTKTLEKNLWNTFTEFPGKPEEGTPNVPFSQNSSDRYSFEIRSGIDRDQIEQWCLQENFANKKAKNLLVAKTCDGSQSQKWNIDQNGFIRNLRLRDKCIRKAGRYLKFGKCDRPGNQFLKWFILSEDQTIRWANNALMTIRVHAKFATSALTARKVAPVQLGNVVNRSARSNEKWNVVYDSPPTPSPTSSPSMYYSDKDDDDDGDIVIQFLTDMSMQCLDDESSLTDALTSRNPFNMLQNYCDSNQMPLFEKGLETYEQCSGASILEFIQSIGSAVFGGAMTCLPYLYDNYFSNDDDFFEQSAPTFPLPRIPQQCVDSFLGDNSVGNFMRNELTMTKNGMTCLAELGQSVPDCTLYRWPVPIVGPLLKVASCAYPMFEDIFSMSCEDELSVLSQCLPSVSEMENATDEMCYKWIDQCAQKDMEFGPVPFFGMSLPPPLTARPLNDICHDPSLDGEVSKRYEFFRDECIPEKDKKIWEKMSMSV